jgi:hypothetical protein
MRMNALALGFSSIGVLVAIGCSGNPNADIGASEGEQTSSPTLPTPSEPDTKGTSSSGGSSSGAVTPDPKDDDVADAGPKGDATTPATDGGKQGTLVFGDVCKQNKDCASNVCFDFQNKGKRCTKACASDLDCVGLVPSLGCNVQQKVCRVSDLTRPRSL